VRSSGKADYCLIRVGGLGLRPGLFCPHHDSEEYHTGFAMMVLRSRTIGIACDENAAVWYHDAGAACVSSMKRAKAHLYRVQDRELRVERYGDGEVIPVAALDSRPKSN
jgi:dipeptidase E